MIEMAKKKPVSDATKTGRARDRGDTRLLNVEISAALDDALEARRQKERRTKRAIVELALEAYLQTG